MKPRKGQGATPEEMAAFIRRYSILGVRITAETAASLAKPKIDPRPHGEEDIEEIDILDDPNIQT